MVCKTNGSQVHANLAANCPETLKEAMLEALVRELNIDDVATTVGEDWAEEFSASSWSDVQGKICARMESVLALSESLLAMFCSGADPTVYCQRLSAVVATARALKTAFCANMPLGYNAVAAEAGKVS